MKLYSISNGIFINKNETLSTFPFCKRWTCKMYLMNYSNLLSYSTFPKPAAPNPEPNPTLPPGLQI